MKSVSLIYGYSARNAGDFAITLGAVDLLLESGVSVKLFSRYCKKNKDFYDSKKLVNDRYGDKVKVFESPFCLDREDSVFKTALNYFDGIMSLIGIKNNANFKRELLESDIVIFNGGNLFRCESFIDMARLSALMYPLQIAKKKNKPYLIFPQSSSNLNKFGKNKLLPILNGAKTVFFREKKSFEHISKLTSSDNFKQTIDLAFFINKDSLKQRNDIKPNTIAITLRFHTVGDIAYLSERQIGHIFEQLGLLVSTYNKQYSFVIVVQTDKDKELSQKFADEYSLELIKSNDPVELLEIYQSVHMLFGMRLHSIILALSVGTPCYGIFMKQWGLKNPGLMSYFDMPHFMLDDDAKQNDEVIDTVSDILAKRSEYSEKILNTTNKEYHNIKSVIDELI